jgi:hypothetical protein
MFMSESKITPHIAPRNIEGLLKMTPFRLRLLGEDCGGLKDDASKMAWHNLKTPEARADYVLKLLKEWDAGNPGAAAPTNGAVPSSIAQSTQPVSASSRAPQVAQVSQQAAQAAAAAAAADKPRRSPRTSAQETQDATSAPADLGAEVIKLLHQVLKETEAGTESYRTVEKKLLETNSQSAAVIKGLEALNAQVQQVQQVQLWTLMAFLTFMQDNVGASTTEILGAAISDSAQFQQLVRQATTGKG